MHRLSLGECLTIDPSNLSKNLIKLLQKNKIKPAELARLAHVPQPTIHRIVSGTSTRPHLSSIRPIADFFSITIEQLVGLKPIPFLNNDANIQILRSLPIIDWTEVIDWLNNNLNSERAEEKEKAVTDIACSEKTFGLIIKDAAMEPLFSIGSTIIIDPDRPIKDRGFILAKLGHCNEPVLRQIIIDANDYYIKAVSPALNDKMHKITKDDRILGGLIQAKRNFID